MNKKIIPGIGIGIAIIVMILATQNVQIEPENNIVETNVGCVSEFKIMFPDEDESKIKDLCDNSEPIYELMNFEDISDNNSYGFRGQDFSAIKPSNTYRIFLVGGSTMWGSGSYSYETTIPGIFQKIFDKQKLETNVEVINAGFHGANSITELKLIKERLVDLQPDLIIIYDGWNDLRAEYSAEIIHNNWKSICEIGNKNKFDVVISLQPIAGFGNKDLTQQENVNAITGTNHNNEQLLLQKNQYEEYADKLKELSTICTKTEDLRDIFDDVNGSIFWDQGHIGDAGNMIIAEKLYKASLPITQKGSITNYKIFNDILKKYNNPTVISYILQQYDIDINNNYFKDQKSFSTSLGEGLYFELKQKIGVNNILIGKDFRNVDLSEMNLIDKNLTGANLSGQDLRNIDLTGTILTNVDLTNANLSGLNFTGRSLEGCILNGTNVSETILHHVNMNSCYISDTDFSDSVFGSTQFVDSTIIDSDFSYLRLVGNIFARSNISNSDFSNSDLSFSKSPSHLPYQIQIERDEFEFLQTGTYTTTDQLLELSYEEVEKLINIILYGNMGANPTLLLYEVEVEDEIINVSYLVVNNFADSNISNVDFSNSDFSGVSFAGATLLSLDLSDANLQCVGHEMCLGLLP